MVKNEISVSDILHALLSHIVFILICALICGMIAFGYTKGFVNPLYKATIKLYAVSNINQDATQISVNEQNASAQLANTYALILKSDTVMQTVADKLKEMGYNYGSGALNGMVATAKTETQVFTVTVTAPSNTAARDIANTIYDYAPAKIVELVGSGEVRGIDRAKLPGAPSSPNISSNTVVGVVIGLLLACAIVIIRTLTDTTIWTEEDIAKQIDVPILGTVPQLSGAEKEAAQKSASKAAAKE